MYPKFLDLLYEENPNINKEIFKLKNNFSSDKNFINQLIENGIINEDILAKTISLFTGIPFIDLSLHKIEPQVVYLFPEELLRKYNVLPVAVSKNELSLAMNPFLDISSLEEIELTTGYRIKPFLSTTRKILFVINQYYSAKQSTKQTIIDMQVSSHKPGRKPLEDIKVSRIDDTPIMRLTTNIIDAAINDRASDIHFEPQDPEMRIRFRIDGFLHDVMTVPKSIEPSIISRIKIMANMDITEKRQSQDGHVTIKRGEKEYDLRISSYSTIEGEKVVIRILNKETMFLELEKLGMIEEQLELTKALIKRPYGMILVTGPTGCGKTTTLYGILSRLNDASTNIMTIEEPVEYKLPGINQAQVNRDAGITFATGLRSILRQDPNIIMVGEIRDTETAEIAIQSALTGHLVFSTLHTNDAPSAITRLIDMKIEPYLISSSIIGVIAQRLVRKTCEDCKVDYLEKNPEILKELNLDPHKFKNVVLSKGKGCQFCHKSGYFGRTGIFEIMKFTENISNATLKERPLNEIRKIAVSEGMITMMDAGIKKVLSGITTLEELHRAVYLGS